MVAERVITCEEANAGCRKTQSCQRAQDGNPGPCEAVDAERLGAHPPSQEDLADE